MTSIRVVLPYAVVTISACESNLHCYFQLQTVWHVQERAENMILGHFPCSKGGKVLKLPKYQGTDGTGIGKKGTVSTNVGAARSFLNLCSRKVLSKAKVANPCPFSHTRSSAP